MKKFHNIDLFYLIVILGTIALALILFHSCKSSKPMYTTVIEKHDTSYIEKYHDTTVVVTKRDSSSVRAWLHCDSLGHVYMSQIQELQGKKIQTQFILKNNYIYVQSNTDSVSIAEHIKSVLTNSNNTVQKVTVPVEVYKLHQYQVILIWCGWILIILLILGALYLVYRTFKPKA